jgi:hypothetical protein
MNEPEGETDMINPDVGNPITNKVGTAYFETFNGKPCLTLEPHSYFWDENANYWTLKNYTPDMTFSCFVSTRGISDWESTTSVESAFMGFGRNTDNYSKGNGVCIGKHKNGASITFEWRGHYNVFLTSSNTPDDTWYLLTVSIKNGVARCYTNGVYKGGQSRSYKQIADHFLAIGTEGNTNSFGNENVLKFSITEIKIWNRVLSDAEIQMLYNNYNNN